MQKITVTFTDDELLGKVKEHAKKRGMPVSVFMKHCCYELIKQEETIHSINTLDNLVKYSEK